LNNVDNLSRTNSELIKTQQQIATGKRVLQPSDDPLAASQIIMRPCDFP
jgi:flagellar hook-associated protein 3 FlgL